MQAANAGMVEDGRIVLRFGINLGDVMVEGVDRYGDRVNMPSPHGVFVNCIKSSPKVAGEDPVL